jgi:hypothetical protein
MNKKLLVCCLLFIVLSCSDNSNENEKLVNATYESKIDGRQWNIANSGFLHPISWSIVKNIKDEKCYQIEVDFDGDGFIYRIKTDNILLNHDYIFVFGQSDWIEYREGIRIPNQLGAIYYGSENNFYIIPTGKIRITAFDGKLMSGTFETSLNNAYANVQTNQTRKFTEGKFLNAPKNFNSL